MGFAACFIAAYAPKKTEKWVVWALTRVDRSKFVFALDDF